MKLISPVRSFVAVHFFDFFEVLIMKKIFKSGLSLLLALTFVLSSAYVGLSKVEFSGLFAVEAKAASTVDNAAFITKLNNVKSRFRQNEYFAGNDGTGHNLTQTTTTLICTGTNAGGTTCVSTNYCAGGGWCTCKCGTYYYGGIARTWQCWGFACQVGYDIFGVDSYGGWNKHKNASNIKAGDIVRFSWYTSYAPHSVFVTKVENGTVYYADCNSSGPCKVNWNNSMSVSRIQTLLNNRTDGEFAVYHAPNSTVSANPNTTVASLVTPTISFNKSSYTIGDTIVVSWKPSPSNSNLSHYWISVYDSDDYMIINQSIDKSKTSISFSIPKVGTYKVKIYATPIGSVSGEGSLTDTKSFTINPKPVTYSITYNANGGSGAPAAQTKTHGVTLTLSSTKPTRSGYTFLGWSTSSSATSATYSAGGSFNINANTTLYAVWKQNIVKCSNPTMKTISNKVTGVSVEWNSVSGADSYYVYRQVGSGSWSLIASGVTKCSYLDTSVVSGTVYKYKVRAYNKAGLSDDHNNYRTIKFLSVPKVSKVTNLVSGLKVQWNAVPGATKYYIHRRGANGNFEYITATTSTTFVDTEIKNKNGYVYWYTIKSSDGTDVSSYYAAGSANLIKAKRLSAPKISSLKNTTSGIEVKWNKIGGAKGYNVYRKTSSSGWKLIAKVTSTSYVDKSVKNSAGTIYQYTIRATYDSYISSYYDANSVNTPKIKRLLTPDVLSATSYKSGIQVKWKSVKGASGYYVYRKTTGGWQKIATVKGGTKYLYTDKTAKKGTTYTYTVKAYSGSHTSGYESGVKCKDKY